MTVPPTTAAAVVPALAEAFTALDEAGHTWALLRGREELADPVGDVDLLVAVPDLAALDATLARVGWLRLPAPGRSAHRFWFRYDAPADRWLKLDVVDRIELGVLHQHRLLASDPLLARRHHDGAAWRPHPEDEQWLHLLHDRYDKGRPAGQRATGLTDDGPVPEALDVLAGRGASTRLRHAPDGPLVLPVVRRLRGAAVATGRRLVRRTHSGRRLPLGRGKVVQLLGPDGAGKSTLAAALAAQLPMDAAVVYLGLWRETRLERRLRPLPGATTVVRLSRAARGAARVRWQVARGRVAVLDRSPYDALLSDADRSAGGRLLARCSLRWVPEPFLVVLLDAPGELLHARKGEHQVEVLERRRQDYLAQHPNALVLDASAPRDVVRQAALSDIWQRLVGDVAG